MTEPTDLGGADMRVEVVKRELNQGALAGFDSTVTDYAANLVVSALDSYDEAASQLAFRRGFELGEENQRLLTAAEVAALRQQLDEAWARANEAARLSADARDRNDALAKEYQTLSEFAGILERDRSARDKWGLDLAARHGISQGMDDPWGDILGVYGMIADHIDALNARAVAAEADRDRLAAELAEARTEREEAEFTTADVFAKLLDVQADRDRLLVVYRAAEAWRDWWATLRPEGGMFAPENGLAAAVDRARRAGAPAEVPDEHRYVSTACQHQRHDECRVTCKFCPARCACTGCDHAAITEA